MSDDNWTILIEECTPLFDSHFYETRTGKTYTFFGLVWGSDDLYYGMSEHGTGKTLLLTCVGNLTTHGFIQSAAPFRERGDFM